MRRDLRRSKSRRRKDRLEKNRRMKRWVREIGGKSGKRSDKEIENPCFPKKIKNKRELETQLNSTKTAFKS